MQYTRHNELCHICDTYSLSRGIFDLEKCNNCNYCNFSDVKSQSSTYQKLSRFRSIMKEFSIIPVQKINEVLAFLNPYLAQHNINIPTSDILKQILTLHDFIKPCASRSYTLVFFILPLFQNSSLVLTHLDKIIMIEFFKSYLNDHNNVSINYNCFFAYAYYYTTGSNLLISPLFIKDSNTSIKDWFEKKYDYLMSEEYEKTQKKYTDSKIFHFQSIKRLTIPVVNLTNI